MPPLTDEQKQKVTEWIAAGLKLGDIQDRLAKDFEIRLTYMDARLLVDDLKLTPKDPEIPVPAVPPDAGTAAPGAESALLGGAPTPSGGVVVAVDQITRPGALVSGKVTFSDGVTSGWYLDQTGRLGLLPTQEGYRPSQEDVADFQAALDRELQKLGM